MARLFPIRSEAPAREGTPRVVDLEDEDADAVFGALSSTTARRIYTHLSDEPGTPSDVAEAVDTSIQNVRYHLEKLEDAGLIEVVDTWYSSRGNEMSVYAPANGPLIVTSDRSAATQLRDALSRFLGGVAVLAVASLLVQVGLVRALSSTGSAGWFAGGDDAGSASEGDEPMTATERSETYERDEALETETVDDGDDSTDVEVTADGGGDGFSINTVEFATEGGPETTDAVIVTLPPGLLFFLGGLLVLTVVTALWYRRARRVDARR
ncbi:ArsR/SmtB family transcription factor [Natronobiforma cellulositropha]|uniref:ArsR/SmtB family transcription factor n=1 Tax=Natronobiforma cellulositropha TaxID=1679076 RepID=UPI0021D5D49F|nr:helix-turn-helix domain-containing protein [Natronobiforma cellulositropha]